MAYIGTNRVDETEINPNEIEHKYISMALFLMGYISAMKLPDIQKEPINWDEVNYIASKIQNVNK